MTRRFIHLAWATLLLGLIDLFLVRDLSWVLENIRGLRFQVNFGLSLLVLFVILQWLSGLRHRSRVMFGLVCAATAVTYYSQAAYFGVYQKYIGVFDLRFFVADPLMSLSLYAENGSIVKPTLAAISSVAVMIWVMGWTVNQARWWRWTGRFVAALSFAILSANWYSAPAFQLAPVAYAGNVVRALDLRAGKNSDAVIDRPILNASTPAANAPNIVWVIGESLTPKHMGIYGYPKQTTPELSKMLRNGDVWIYENAVSIGTRTLVSVPYMLTGLEGIDPLGLIYKTPSIFNYAQSAGYQTALITAQDFQWRNIDRLFVDKDLNHFQQGTDFSSAVNVSVGADDHRVLEKGVFPFWTRALQNKQKPIMLVTQMSGSHPPFASQVPTEYKQFLPENGHNSVNAYDNTVWYTDLYLSKLVKFIREQSPNTWVFFTSDHGQYVGDRETRFHGDMGDPVIHVPLLVFPPKPRPTGWPLQPKAPVSQADILPTILDLMSVEPVARVDGLSLRRPVPADRLRIVSPYMITLYNDPKAAIVLPDRQRHEIDFTQNSVQWSDGRITPYSELPLAWRERFDQRR